MKGISYPPVYSLVSGGKDSLTAAHVLDTAGKLIACVALETGISTPDWKEFVIKTCSDRGWPLEFYATDEKYEDFVRKYGFPGPSKHAWIMQKLNGEHIRIDWLHRTLASALLPKVVDDPDAAAHIIATLLQQQDN